jgi:hypothetical protein
MSMELEQHARRCLTRLREAQTSTTESDGHAIVEGLLDDLWSEAGAAEDTPLRRQAQRYLDGFREVDATVADMESRRLMAEMVEEIRGDAGPGRAADVPLSLDGDFGQTVSLREALA